MANIAKISILIVDDEPEIRSMIHEYLKEHFRGELTIVEANDGVQGLQKVRRQKFNLLISDIKMPKMDGTGLFKSIIEGVESNFQPDNILVLSGHLAPEKHDAQVGKISFMNKPINLEKFKNYLKQIFPQNIKN